MTPEELRLKLQMAAKIRETEYKRISLVETQQKECLHFNGMTGSSIGHNYAFHCLKIGEEIIGVCPYCQLKISSKNPDHIQYFKKIRQASIAETGKEIPMSPDEQWLAAKAIYLNNLQNVYVFWQHWDHILDIREYREYLKQTIRV